MTSNAFSLFGGPTPEEARKAKEQKNRDKEVSSLSSMARELTLVRSEVAELRRYCQTYERILSRSLVIQEKQLLTMNCLLPADGRPLAIGDQEAKARHLLGLSIIGELKEKEIKSQFKLLAKKLHPDVNDGETTEEFINVEKAYNYLIELVSR